MRGGDSPGNRSERIAKLLVSHETAIRECHSQELPCSRGVALTQNGRVGFKVELRVAVRQLVWSRRSAESCPQRRGARVIPTRCGAQLPDSTRIRRHSETKIMQLDRNAQRPRLGGRKHHAHWSEQIDKRPQSVRMATVVDRELGQVPLNLRRNLPGTTPYVLKRER
jgi:hypothetical protein